MRRRHAKWPYRLFFLLLFIPMFCVFPYMRATNNPNEYVRVFTAMSLVDHGTYRIDEPVKLYGWVNDMAHVPSKEDGQRHYFMVKAPMVVHLGVPGYFVFAKIIAPILGRAPPTAKDPLEHQLWWLRMSTWSLRLFGVALPCFLFLLWFEKYLREFVADPVIRYTAVTAAALGTNYLAYVHMFASHSPYAASAFVAFALTERELRLSRGDSRARRPSRAFLAGFFASACVAFEYQSLFPVIVLSLFALAVFWRPKTLVAFGVGGLLNVPPVMYFQWRAYNNPLTPGHQMLETASFAHEHQQGLWGILWPSWDHIVALATDPGFGFFGMSPFMWFGLVAVPLMVFSPIGPPSIRRSLRVSTVVWFLICTVLICVNAGFIQWRAGWTVGPRYLVPCAPFFAFGAACALDRLSGKSPARRAIMRGFGAGMCLASVVSIGTVGLVFDTLPETIARPFAQFTVPMARVGLVPHHVLEWFGATSGTFWYVVCGVALAVPTVLGLTYSPERTLGTYLPRVAAFVIAVAIGMVPALSTPPDGTKLFILHPSTRGLAQGWEPTDRDRIALLRNEAERYGSRRPCMWYRLAEYDRILGDDLKASRDEARAKGAPKENCPRSMF